MKKILLVLAALALFSTMTWGQVQLANIYGTVVLPDGSPIAGVLVTLTGDVIGVMTTVTSDEGNFRFLKLSPGNYELKCQLDGFKTAVRKGIRLYLGRNETMTVPMETSPIKEEIVVTASANVVDTRKTTVAMNITKEMIEALPSARNPWTVLNLIPGMMIDRVDVGGAESGQQSSFYGHGSASGDTVWNVDGANITDNSALGAAPAYLNVNTYDEMQVTMGANEISAQTGGIQINFVTKRAGNRYNGDFHLYREDKDMEMKQTLPQAMINRGYVSPGINRLYMYGLNFGGPVIKDKLWWIGSWAIQDIHGRTMPGTEDTTWLVSGYGKINFQLGDFSGDFHASLDNKMKWGRSDWGAEVQAPGTLWDQVGPAYIYYGGLQKIFGNLMLNTKIVYTDGGFQFTPRASKINPANGHNEGLDNIRIENPQYMDGSHQFYFTNRTQLNFSVDGNYFAEKLLGGDHEIKFGVDYVNADTTSQTLWPNQRALWYEENSPDAYKQIWWITDSIFDVNFKRLSFFASDTVKFGKLVATLGLRYDKESGAHNAATAPGLTMNGQPVLAKYLGPISLNAKKMPVDLPVFSPRLALTYDLTGNGKNLIKLSLARYGSQSGNGLAAFLWTVGSREIDVDWLDKNHNDVVDAGEWSENPDDWMWYNIDPANPYSVNSPNQFDPNYSAPLLDEVSMSFEKVLGTDLAVGITGFYKKNHNLTWNRGLFYNKPGDYSSGYTLETADNWYQKGTFDVNGTQAPYYVRKKRPDGTLRTNFDKSYQQYMALQFMLTKKLSNRWMADASFTFQDWKAVNDPSEVFDKTNYNYFNEGVVAPQSGGSGYTGIYVNSRWMLKLSGLYQLPFGVNISTVLDIHDGFVVPYYKTYNRGSGLGNINMYEANKKFGDDRLPTFWMLNFGLEKTFKLNDKTTATLFVDGYNITNNMTTLKVDNNYASPTLKQALRVMAPGIFQFGFRLNF